MPPGHHDLPTAPGVPIPVVGDTNVLLTPEYRRPLLASAIAGDLAVFWSPAIEREYAKVISRETTLATIRRMPPDQPRAAVVLTLRRMFDTTAATLDAQLAYLERHLRSAVDPDLLDPMSLLAVSDAADRPVLAAALAAQAPYLLSLDARHFPHGAVFTGVRCWHPDTFLTAFFQQAKHYLALDGRILLSFGTTGDIDYVWHLIAQAEFEMEELRRVAGEKDGFDVAYFVYRLTAGTHAA